MGALISVAFALLVIAIGVRHILRRHARWSGVLLFFGAYDVDADGDPWEANGWPAVVIGCVEVAVGLWILRLALHA